MFLARGTDGGIDATAGFFDAYRTYPPGCAHHLIVVAKGWEGLNGLADLRRLAADHGGRVVELPDPGFDWGAYMRLVPTLKHEWVCFLNTHSRPRVQGWLKLLWTTANKKELAIGAVGATASWETVLPSLRLPSQATPASLLLHPLKLCWNIGRVVRNVAHFRPFPNPHLRSNAFLIRRDMFIEFCSGRAFPKTKDEAFRLESGRTGLTAYLESRGLQVFVQGANGAAYGKEAWMTSGTFRTPGQPNLLVNDNQTLAYDSAGVQLKCRLERAAWGRAFSGPAGKLPGACND